MAALLLAWSTRMVRLRGNPGRHASRCDATGITLCVLDMRTNVCAVSLAFPVP
jgi:hypothetical protein